MKGAEQSLRVREYSLVYLKESHRKSRQRGAGSTNEEIPETINVVKTVDL